MKGEEVTTHVTLSKALLKKIDNEIDGYYREEKVRKCVTAGYQFLTNATKDLEKTRRQYVKKSELVRMFLVQKTILDSEAFISKTELYKAFTEYCFTEKLPSISPQKFKTKLLQINPHLQTVRRIINGKHLRCWFGLTMDDEEE